MLDSLKYNIKIAEQKAAILEELNLNSKEYIVATVHRASNTDSFGNLSSIVNAFCDADILIVFPMHPRTEKFLKQYGLWDKLREKVKVIPPLGYLVKANGSCKEDPHRLRWRAERSIHAWDTLHNYEGKY